MADADTIIEIRDLATVFGQGDSAFTVHDQLQLTVRRGEILALVGGSGTGKTVLLRHILGLTRPTRGSVTVLGRPAAELGGEGASARVGMLFQHGALYSAFNVLDNIAFALRELGTLPPALVQDVAMVKLRLAGLKAEHATRMPADLSGGMIKRVALARALILEPQVLLLDEPTSALDASVPAEVLNMLEALRRQRNLSFVMVSHDLAVVTHLCQRLVVMQRGRIVETVTSADLAAQRVQQDYTRTLMDASAGFRRA